MTGVPPLASPEGRWSPFDWIGCVTVVIAITGLVSFPIASFRSMFRDLAPAAGLPWLTQVVLARWVQIGFAAPAGALFVYALGAGLPGARRRLFLSAAFVLACAGVFLCVLGVYVPIFALAGSIKSE